MKKMGKFLGIIAFAAIIGFSMAACDNGTTGGDSGGWDTQSPGGGGGWGTRPPGGGGGTPSDFTPIFSFMDSDGNFSETDTGRTVLIADNKAYVLFYSDDIESDLNRVAFTFGGETIVFFFEEGHSFPTSMTLTDSAESFNGFFTSHNSATQTFGLMVKQGDDYEVWSNIALNRNIFTQFIDDPELTASQNLRMRNLYISMHIYMSLNYFFAPDDSPFAPFIIPGLSRIAREVARIFTDCPMVFAGIDLIFGVFYTGKAFITGNPIALIEGIYYLGNGVDAMLRAIQGIPVTGVSLNRTSLSLNVGDSQTLIPTIRPVSATNRTVSWGSSNIAVATVSSNGTVTGHSAGAATITVRTVDGGRIASCTVIVSAPDNGGFIIGGRGPGGGYIFFDKGYFSDGWRFLEAAPADMATRLRWSTQTSFLGPFINIPGTSFEIGTGMRNTQLILARDPTAPAALASVNFSNNGKTDWFLPSRDELNLMFINLRRNNIGGFTNNMYWSSSQNDTSFGTNAAWSQAFNNNGTRYGSWAKWNSERVRAIRAF